MSPSTDKVAQVCNDKKSFQVMPRPACIFGVTFMLCKSEGTLLTHFSILFLFFCSLYHLPLEQHSDLSIYIYIIVCVCTFSVYLHVHAFYLTSLFHGIMSSISLRCYIHTSLFFIIPKNFSVGSCMNEED